MIFPTLSRFAARNDPRGLRLTLATGTRQLLLLLVPAAAALQGAPVTTVDLDFLFRKTPRNLAKLKVLAGRLPHASRDGAVLDEIVTRIDALDAEIPTGA